MRLLSLLVLAIVGCDGSVPDDVSVPDPEPEVVSPTSSDGFVRLQPVDHLIRASIVLRGVRPTVADMQAVHDDPAALEGLVRGYVQTPEFGDTIRDMWAEILLLRNDSYNQLPAVGTLSDKNLQEMFTGTSEEPLKLVEHIVMNDLPFTELVTADYMLTDGVVAKMYGVPQPDPTLPDDEWQLSWWGDERPVAGILSSAQMWRRWESNGSNFHRGRANVVARELLCESFDHRDILVPGGIDIADEAAVAFAVRTETACVGCHAALDPLAGYFWGYKQLIHRNFVGTAHSEGCTFDWSNGQTPEFGASYLYEYYCYPLQQYNVADEFLFLDWGLPEPGYYAIPARDLGEVGEIIAEDPRFSECQARQFYGYYSQIEPEAVPVDVAIELQQSFQESGFNAKELAVDSVLRDDFTILRSADPAAVPPPNGGLLTVRPEQYARTVESLTGYRWMAVGDQQDCNKASNKTVGLYGNQCWGAVDLSDSDLYGFRAMAGGVDGVTVTRATHTATPTKMLVMGALAEDAAAFVVDADLAGAASDRKLLNLVESGTADETSIRAQLAALHLELLGEFTTPDSEAVTLSYTLWTAAHAESGDPVAAWKITLAGLLQDPRMMFF